MANERRSRSGGTAFDFSIRQLAEMEEYSDVVRLEKQIWGYQDAELLPLRLFVVANKIGGQVLGAFDGRNMVGFCLCIPGLKADGKSYLHSHMLGVLPEYRNTGLGRRMKLKQREYALAVGVDLIEWTFDPLELKNAFFNIERLGAVVRRYVRNQYGTTTSRLHGGLPTDRLIAEWWIQSPRVKSLVESGEERAGTRNDAEPMESEIALPADIGAIREDDALRARDLQSAMGARFEQEFQAGLAVVGFEKTEREGKYLLGRWESK